MSIHPEIAKILTHIPPAATTPPEPAQLRAEEAKRIPPAVPLHNVTDTTLAGVPVRSYSADATTDGLIVYLHGGAFFSGSLDTHDHVARALAKETGHKVISVGYSLTPEVPFPKALNECLAVLHEVVDKQSELGWSGNLALAGDSSGANFVAALTGMAKDEGFKAITHQILFYPSVDLDFDQEKWPSLRENAEGYGLEYNGLAPFNSFYLQSADPADPRVSPIKRADLSGLPKALVVTAGFDPLRDEGEAYAEGLKNASVDTTLLRYDNANHGFIVNFSWIPEFYEVFHETAKFLNS